MSIRDGRSHSSQKIAPSTGLSEQFDNMSIASGSRTPRVTTEHPGSTTVPKVSVPEPYSGKAGGLEEFLLQIKLYLIFNKNSFPREADKVLYASSYLRGRAARSFRPYLKDWLDHEDEEKSLHSETRRVFYNYANFEEKLETLFGISNEQTHADRQIRRLRQYTSVTAYASEFQGYQADLDWNDAALRSQFYLGLKDVVKAELSREKPTNLSNMIRQAKDIDERLQELKQDQYYYREGAGRRSKATNDDPYGPVPMELDATERGLTRPGTTKGKRMRINKRDIRCYACQQLGHMARDCRADSRW